jgi:MFS family permease
MNKPAPSPTLVMALISIPIFIGALDLTVVSAVLPQVAVDLQIPQTEISSAAWIVSGYLLAYTLAMTFMGRLSDLVGRRRVYLLALAVFALGSYLVAVADGWPTNLALRADYIFFAGRPDPMRVKLYLLVAARMIQAFGGGAMVPVGMALAGDLYPAGRRARALGLIAAVDTSGWVVGHLYGGIIAYSFDWRIIFWLNLPACLIGFLLIAWALRRLPSPSPGGRMDWAGAALIVLCLIVLNIGLGSTEAGGTFNGGGEAGLPPYALPLTAAALILLGLFLWRQARAAQPLIPLSLFRRANFSLAGLENFLIGFCLFAAIAGVPLFINTLVAQSIRQGAWESGWMLSALTVPMALAAIPGGWLTARFGYRLPALAGLAVTVAGFLLMSGWRADPAGGAAIYPGMIPHLVLAGIGFGLTIAPLAAAAIDTAPSDYRGTASALVLVFRLIGMTLSATAIAAFDQQRFNQLSADFLAAGNDLVTAAVEAVTRVISETFLLSAAICALALLLALLLRPFLSERNSP